MASILERTLYPFGLGMGSTGANFIGGLGAAMEGLANFHDEQARAGEFIRNNSVLGHPEYATDYEARNYGIPPTAITPQSPEQYNNLPPSALHDVSQWLFDTSTGFQNSLNTTRNNLYGTSPDMLQRSMEGLGAMTIPATIEGVAALAGHPYIGTALGGIFEAGSEAGEFANDAYSKGQYNGNAQSIAGQNFLANLALKGALATIPGAGGWQRIPRELAEEVLVENPVQKIINESSHDAFNNGNDFLLWDILQNILMYPSSLREELLGR